MHLTASRGEMDLPGTLPQAFFDFNPKPSPIESRLWEIRLYAHVL